MQKLDGITYAIATLSGSRRETFILRTQEGFTQSETAGMLGVTEKAVEIRL